MLAGQAGQLAYPGGGDLLELRREPAAGGRDAQIASLTTVASSTRSANRWCPATSRSAFSSSGPGFRCTFTVLPPMRRVRLYCGP